MIGVYKEGLRRQEKDLAELRKAESMLLPDSLPYDMYVYNQYKNIV